MAARSRCRWLVMMRARSRLGSWSRTWAQPLDAGDLAQVRQIEAMGVVIVRLLFGGYDPYSVFSFVSPGRTGDPFTSR
jgi:hypothetical protein